MKTSLSRRTLVVGGLLGIALVVIIAAAWKHFHAAHAHDHGAAVLSLDEGRRWKTDAPLRTGMQKIRDAAVPSLAAFARNELTAPQAKELSAAISANFAYMAEHCKLPPKADATLHVLVVELMRGAELLARDPRSHEGADVVAKVLRQYAEYFEHPGWEPLPELKV
jgi:hypothetical protein